MLNGNTFDVETVCHPQLDMISTRVTDRAHAGINLRFPYPTGAHADDACNWDANDKHSTEIVRQDAQSALLKRTLDETTYYVTLRWEGKAALAEKSKNYFVLTPEEDMLALSCRFTANFEGTVFESEPGVYSGDKPLPSYAETAAASDSYWTGFWKTVRLSISRIVRIRVLRNWNAVSC